MHIPVTSFISRAAVSHVDRLLLLTFRTLDAYRFAIYIVRSPYLHAYTALEQALLNKLSLHEGYAIMCTRPLDIVRSRVATVSAVTRFSCGAKATNCNNNLLLETVAREGLG